MEVGFFDRLLPDEGADGFELDRWDPGDDVWWTPGVIPWQYTIGRSDKAAVLATTVSVHRKEFTFVLEARIRRPRTDGYVGDLTPLRDATDDGEGSVVLSVSDDVLRFAIQFPDGQQVTNLDFNDWSGRAGTPSCGLETDMTRGGDGCWFWNCRAWPVPVTGELMFVCEWPGFEIPESRLVVPAADFADALARMEPIWPN